MKKLIYISTIALSLTISSVSFAQQGTPLSEEEYNIVISAVCDTNLSVTEVIKEVENQVEDNSINLDKSEMLKDMALGLSAMPLEEKANICE